MVQANSVDPPPRLPMHARPFWTLKQLATNEWIPSTSVLEGVVILTRNPELDDPPSAGKEESKGAKD